MPRPQDSHTQRGLSSLFYARGLLYVAGVPASSRACMAPGHTCLIKNTLHLLLEACHEGPHFVVTEPLRHRVWSGSDKRTPSAIGAPWGAGCGAGRRVRIGSTTTHSPLSAEQEAAGEASQHAGGGGGGRMPRLRHYQ